MKVESKSTFCLKTFVGISGKWGAWLVSNLYFLYVNMRHCFERKTKIEFCQDCLNTWMTPGFRFPGVWQSKLFGTSRSKLSIFVKILHNFKIISKQFSVFKIAWLTGKNLFTVFQKFSLSTMFFKFKFQ